MPVERITIFCFAASYAVALVVEILQQARPRPMHRVLATVAGSAGLLAQTLFLGAQRPPIASQFGPLLVLSWVLAVFYLYGSIHHRREAWGVFVLPVVLGLVGLAVLVGPGEDSPMGEGMLGGEGFWRIAHVALFLLASVGMCVAFVASVMYLVQARRLRTKKTLGPRPGLLSLERLEQMNRRAINLAFSLLTIGMLVSLARMMREGGRQPGWTDVRVILSSLLWLVAIVVLSLRYGFHLRGRRMAALTILAFVLLLVTLVTAHGGTP